MSDTTSRHGTMSRYVHQRCRCERCRESMRSYTRSLGRVRAAVRDASIAIAGSFVAVGIKHGYGGYNNHKCRCAVCVNGRREYNRAYRERRREATR